MTRSTTLITPLTASQRRIGAHIVWGLSNSEIAGEEHLTLETVRSHISTMRLRLHCPPRASRAVLAHTLLRLKQVPPPELTLRHSFMPDTEGQRLIHALAEHSPRGDIARAAGIPTGALRTRTDVLVRQAGAANVPHLIGLAHTHGILGTDEPTTTPPPPNGPAGAAR
ncbi:LuxR C-terminal-related transcriptional regulator [Streptomyces zhihengii]|uniref:LuxR C-terminal-related transcriptional regulator n=1 Tax=Streptomyces zhihengii TaxID=1818004 RepID=UPI0036267EB9